MNEERNTLKRSPIPIITTVISRNRIRSKVMCAMSGPVTPEKTFDNCIFLAIKNNCNEQGKYINWDVLQTRT